jgi:CDP-6-deoxy-D-xylo-4-hexulose-3-dehydrase
LTGTFGDIATHSFYPPHHMTLGEGGAVCTSDPKLQKILLSLRDWGRDCACPSGHDNLCKERFSKQFGELPFGYDHKYVFSHFGYNLKATDMQAAIGCAQLEKLPSFIEARKKNWKLLRDGLVEFSDKLLFQEPSADSDPSWFGFMITDQENAGFTRDPVVKHLEKAGIQTRMLFAGNLIKQPCFDEMRKTGSGYRVVGDLAVTDRIMRDAFWVGVYPGVVPGMIEYVIAQIGTVVSSKSLS